MKTSIRFAVFLQIILFISTISGQSNTKLMEKVDSTLQKLKQFESRVDEKYYTRIPNSDFEDLIEIKIAKAVDEKFTFWFTTIGIIITFIGGISVFGARKYITDEVAKRVQEEVESSRDKLKSEIEKGFQDETKKYIYSVELEKIRNEMKSNMQADKSEELQNLLTKTDEIGYKELIPQIIDDLTRIYFYSRKINEIEELIDKYGKTSLFSTTWVNAALGLIDEYEAYGSKQRRDKAIIFLDNSLEITPGYGEAQGSKLLIYMINYSKSKSEEEKELVKKNTTNLLDEINTSIPVSGYETMRRINASKKSSIFGKYIDDLYQMFPEEMKTMETRSNQFTMDSKSKNNTDNI